MKQYRVSVSMNTDTILKLIRQVKAGEHFPWSSRDFYCRRSAEYYAYLVVLNTGSSTKIIEKNPDQYSTLRERVRHILGAE